MSDGEPAPPRGLHVTFAPTWHATPDAAGRGGLLAPDERMRTLLGILLSYPDVRYVLPDRVSLDAATEPHVLETLRLFLQRQRWLVRAVSVT